MDFHELLEAGVVQENVLQAFIFICLMMPSPKIIIFAVVTIFRKLAYSET